MYIRYNHSILHMSIEYSYDIWCCLGKSVYNLLKLKFYSYKVKLIQELNDDDPNLPGILRLNNIES